MPGAGAHLGTHQFLDVRGAVCVGQEANLPFQRQADHDPERVPLRNVEEPEWRHAVRANRVQTIGRHLREVLLDNIRVGIFAIILKWTKRSVGDTADIQFLIAAEEKFAMHAWPKS